MLNGAERNYSATELECLAVVWGIRRMRGYLEGYHFTVITDHQSLKWLQRIEEPTGRLGRWMFEFQQYEFDVQYRKGTQNQVADVLSRQPEATCNAQDASNCPWYTRQLKWVIERPIDFPDYYIQDGKLYWHLLHELDFRDKQWKRCIPRNERPQLLRRFHDEPTVGHLGIAKTVARMAQLYYWPRMLSEITEYVRRCPSCLAYKVSQQKPAGTLHATAVKEASGSKSRST